MSLIDEAAQYIKKTDSVVDIGPGIRPQTFFKPKSHLCIEPHWEYANWLRDHGYEVIQGPVQKVLGDVEDCDTIFMLDVIEHLHAVEVPDLLTVCKMKSKQVVILTPVGFLKQEYEQGEKDAWGMNGTYWQTHRSGWEPKDFPGWRIITGQLRVPMFFAIYE